MNTLSVLKQNCPQQVPMYLNECIGSGANGDVYSLQDNKSVIKLSIMYDLNYDNNVMRQYESLYSVLNELQRNEQLHIAKTFDVGILYVGSRVTDVGEQKYLIHSYSMEKLLPISDDEYKVFSSLLSHEDSGKAKDYSATQTKEMLKNLSVGLDFNNEDVMLFVESLKESNIIHNDLHPRNIMKNKLGCFKLIDLDSCKFKPEIL